MALRSTTTFQRIALGMLLLAAAGWFTGLSHFLWILMALGLCMRAFRKQLFWRVRNRLLLTVFLFSVIPIGLIGLMLVFTVMPFLGHFAAEKVRADLESRIAATAALAQDIAVATSRATPPEVLNAMRERVPGMSALVRINTGTKLFPSDGPIATIPPGFRADFQGVLKFQGQHYLAARASRNPLNTDVLVYLPIDDALLASLSRGVVDAAAFFGGDEDLNVHSDLTEASVLLNKGGVRTRITSRRLPASKGRWDVPLAGILFLPTETLEGKPDSVAIVVLSRPSMLLAGFRSSPEFPFIAAIILIVGGVLLTIQIVAFVRGVLHARTITRSVHDLYAGTLRVADGNFDQPIPVRGHDQLSDLAASFNGMTAKIQHFLGEMKKKEKMESELEIARQVQARLFPRTVPELRTLEMQGTCIPGRFISGDYYDFVKLNDRYTAIALGDVSGKGVSAALLMASIQASLHAQLGFGRGAENPVLSTATLMALIGQQLYESTPAEKYATFFCSVYDDQTGVLRYTNAGHLQPILIREGKSSTLPGDGMVVGLLPNVKYEQQEMQLLPGDVIAIFSDGIPEAENATAQEYGETRLSELLAGNAGAPLDILIQTVTESVDAWAHDPAARDDTTIIVMRRT